MKNRVNLVLIIIALGFTFNAFGQKKEIKDVKYRRSSLHIVLMESDRFPMKDTVMEAYNEAPFPDKYNNHTIGEKTFDPMKFLVTPEEMKAAGIKKTKKDIEKGRFPETPLIIDKYIKDYKIANKLVAKWFGRAENGAFDMSLIGERGMYDASQVDISVSKGTARGSSALADAGEDLINNTFVVFNKLKFVENEIVAAITRDVAIAAASQLGTMAQSIAELAANAAYEKAKEGYSVWTTSYLYQLEWNDSIAAVFYNDLWVDNSGIDTAKANAFFNSDLFSLKFVGDEKASSLVTFSLKKGEGNRSEADIIKLATVRNLDAVYAKLQKKYDVFKTKTPLFSGVPLTAKIGLKEGIKGGDKFEVLEQMLDMETGKTTYKRKGVIKVDKKQIWDNRYSADETAEPQVDKKGNPIETTLFKGGKNFYQGMLIRQIK